MSASCRFCKGPLKVVTPEEHRCECGKASIKRTGNTAVMSGEFIVNGMSSVLEAGGYIVKVAFPNDVSNVDFQ